MPVVPAHWRMKHEDHDLEVSLDYIARRWLKTYNKKKKKEWEESKTRTVPHPRRKGSSASKSGYLPNAGWKFGKTG